MEYKDKRISDFTDDEAIIYQRGYRHGSEAEREISFEAGQDSVFDSMPDNLPPLLGAAHRSGIKEVVKFVNDWTKRCPLVLIDKIALNEALGMQLKEWGIEGGIDGS